MGAALGGALAAVSLEMLQSLDFRSKSPAKRDVPPESGHSFRSRKRQRQLPNGMSGQTPSKDRLLGDRSSSVRKMQRWLNAGTMQAPAPKTDRHLQRHGWYRRQLERQDRAVSKEARHAPA